LPFYWRFLVAGLFRVAAYTELHTPSQRAASDSPLSQLAALPYWQDGLPLLVYWICLCLRPTSLPLMAGGLHAENIPPAYRDLSISLIEIFGLPGVTTVSSGSSSPPCPAPRSRHLPWRIAWCHLSLTSPPPASCRNCLGCLKGTVAPV
jgi:hypothetical protein